MSKLVKSVSEGLTTIFAIFGIIAVVYISANANVDTYVLYAAIAVLAGLGGYSAREALRDTERQHRMP